MLERTMQRLICFALQNGLIEPADRYAAYNALLDLFHLEAPEAQEGCDADESVPETATSMLSALCDEAVARGLIEDTATRREIFSTRLMGVFMARPSEIARHFHQLYTQGGPRSATDWFYALCRKSNYIRVDAIARNIRFFAPSEYGELEITINLSKPEKDPRDIAALLTKKSSAEYPRCMLCTENEGYAGRLDFPARQTLRTVPLTLSGSPWHMQYSPYLYYEQHCIVFNDQHIPMKVSRGTFERLLEFITIFPHYFIGSNADLPIVGGSILNHDHFQGGCYHFPMEKAPAYATCTSALAPDVQCEMIAWPLTTLRLRSENRPSLIALADHVLSCWRNYSDESVGVLSHTGDTLHNTITPIARREGDVYVLDLVLRNNRTTPEMPLGIFHPHADLHHIKKENIGLIEVMGLFILPGRLDHELSALEEVLCGQRSLEEIEKDEKLRAHLEWITMLCRQNGQACSPEQARAIIREALSKKCARVLHDAGVFKLDDAGKAAMVRFLCSAGFQC